jgi:uncharacterized membrane protein
LTDTFFTQTEQQDIVEAIKVAELNTSGEIRVHIEARCKGDAYKRAKEVFEHLGMHATELKNGVLFYLAYQDKKFAILGDKGIHEKVSQQFWDEEKVLLLTYFKQQKYAEGLCLAIEQAGEKLKHHFPYKSNDTNELSNEISFGNGGNNE